MTDRLLTATEVAELLAVPESWVREQSRRPDGDAIPHLRLGRYVRFERDAVVGWLDGQRAGRWRKHEPKASA
jgi:excisionase family DNA binding protein